MITLLPMLAAALHAHVLTQQLRQSRERLVTAREDERLRLRRDLHDGLGPALAGISLELQAARTIVDIDRDGAVRMLDSAEGWARDALHELRRVVYGLRPPVLDQLGLARALEEHVVTLARQTEVTVDLQLQGPLGGLPAATEVAAYLIALEAITNVLRHASADTCTVSLTADPQILDLQVVDDGDGMHDGVRFGVGLTSMRERAEELGGSLVVQASRGGGTTVVAQLPVVSA